MQEVLEELGITEEEALQRLEKYPEELELLTKIPYGYKEKGDGTKTIVRVDEVCLYLDIALDQLDNRTASYRQALAFLNSRTQKYDYRELSVMGFRKVRFKFRPESERENIKPAKGKRLSKLERSEYVRKRRIANAKRTITAQKKRVQKLSQELKEFQDASKEEKEIEKEVNLSPIIEIPVPVILKEIDYSELKDTPKVFDPHPKQALFLSASETQVLYGGAAGGGKSYALLADAMRWFDFKNFNGLIVRRTIDELRDLRKESDILYKAAFPKAEFKQKDNTWVFPSGARLWMSYLDREEDVEKYRGLAFSWIGFDELTQWPTPYAWNFLFSRLRSTDPILSQNLAMRATSNPGGPGHGWVKKMFIDPAPSNTSFWATDIETEEVLTYPENFRIKELQGAPIFKRKFIPANLYDNPSLMEDGNYERNLMSLPENQRRQLLEGDWTVADGAAFGEFRLNTHVIEPFEIPRDWRKFRSCDFGYSTRQASAVHWYAIRPWDNALIVYRELYVNQHTGIELAKRILELEAGENISYGVLDSSVWAQRGHNGPSIAEEMIKAGCRWRPSDRTQGSRIASKNRLHELLRVNSYTQEPGILFFNTCRKIISTLPVIPQDPESEDIDPDYTDDHAYDSIRYGIMTRPRAVNIWETFSQSNRPQKKYTPQDSIFGY